jgi:hypothetical protein
MLVHFKARECKAEESQSCELDAFGRPVKRLGDRLAACLRIGTDLGR